MIGDHDDFISFALSDHCFSRLDKTWARIASPKSNEVNFRLMMMFEISKFIYDARRS